MSRRARFLAALCCALGSLVALPALAQCGIGVTPVTVVYDQASPTQSVTTGSWTVTNCAGTPWTLGATNGTNPQGNNRRATQINPAGAQTYTYNAYRASPYNAANRWNDGAGQGNPFSGTGNVSGSFDIVLAAGQTPTIGVYQDTLVANLRTNPGGTLLATTTFTVTVYTIGTCVISTPPGNVNFTYTSLQVAAATANATYGVRCTNGVSYAMSLDATSGTLLGLSYSLSVPASGTGTGAAQTHTISGTMPGGQAGTCASAVCSGSEMRTLTLSW